MIAIRLLLPSLSAMHHIDDLTPEEDIVPLGHVMASALFPTAFYLPTYIQWLQTNKEALSGSARYLKRYLDEHLRFDDRPWVLKAPWHLALLRDLHREFPSARYVWMHRNPLKSMSSTSSLVLSLIGMNSDLPQNLSFVALAANETTEFWRWALDRGVEARKDVLDKNQVFDVEFGGFAKDPVATIRDIYKHFKLPLPLEAETRMHVYAKENARGHRFGSHNYKDAPKFLNEKSVQVAFDVLVEDEEEDHGCEERAL